MYMSRRPAGPSSWSRRRHRLSTSTRSFGSPGNNRTSGGVRSSIQARMASDSPTAPAGATSPVATDGFHGLHHGVLGAQADGSGMLARFAGTGGSENWAAGRG